MNNISEIRTKKPINLGKIVIYAMAICSLSVGFVPAKFIAYAMLMLCAVLLITDELYLALPFIMFYNEWYGVVFGASVQRFFTLMLLVLALIKLGKEKKITIKYFAPFVVFALYSVLVITQYSATRAIFSVIDVLCCIFLISSYLSDADKMKRFFSAYALTGTIAIITGLVNQNVMSYSNLNRFLATFEDPNYMSFFYTIAVFSIMSLKLFKPWLRTIIVIVFTATIISAASITSIIVNIILWLIYVTLMQKINIKTLIAFLALLVLIVGIYEVGLNSSNDTILGQMSGRIEEKLQELEEGNVDGATTGRSELIENHLEYFFKQSIWKKLVGGTPVNTHYISNEVDRVAHNEYVDLLINVGIIGTVTLLWFYFKNLFVYFKKYIQSKDSYYLSLVMIKFGWAAYAMSLTLFMDYRFMYFFFV